MDPLLALFRPAVELVNRQIGESTPARALCKRLDGRTVAIRVRNTALSVALTVSGARLELTTIGVDEPDAVITGSLLSLAFLAGDDGEALVRDGTVELTGDAVVANDFRELLHHGRPDWEEQLANVVGDVAAHGIGDVLRGVGRWSHDAQDTFRQNLSEYLQEESRTVPSRYEVDEFGGKVQTLRDDVARVEARIALLESRARDHDA